MPLEPFGNVKLYSWDQNERPIGRWVWAKQGHDNMICHSNYKVGFIFEAMAIGLISYYSWHLRPRQHYITSHSLDSFHPFYLEVTSNDGKDTNKPSETSMATWSQPRKSVNWHRWLRQRQCALSIRPDDSDSDCWIKTVGPVVFVSLLDLSNISSIVLVTQSKGHYHWWNSLQHSFVFREFLLSWLNELDIVGPCLETVSPQRHTCSFTWMMNAVL